MRGCRTARASRDEVRRFAHEIGLYLERSGVKMVVVACNTATSVALPDLQAQLARAGRRA